MFEKYYDDSWLKSNNWGKWGKEDEVGVLNDITPESILQSVALIKQGKIIDLETLRFKGMPVWEGHCGFELLSYASPFGRKNMAKSDYSPAFSWNAPGGFLAENNDYHSSGNTEMMITPLHVGTHIDGFCHVCWGEDYHWYNGYNNAEDFSDFGPLKADAATIPPVICRGILLDIAAYKKTEHLDPHYGITIEDVIACAEWEGVALKPKDCVLFRCGERWPEMDLCPGAGPTLATIRYLAEEKGAILFGDDMIAFEQIKEDGTYSWPGCNQPVHHYALNQQGIHFIECMQLQELSDKKIYEFCFIMSPTKIKGGTGMFLRPLAVY